MNDCIDAELVVEIYSVGNCGIVGRPYVSVIVIV